MFKPVTGAGLSAFDAETIALYRKRETDPQTTLDLLTIPRRARHHLPIFLDKESNKQVVEWERQHEQYWWKIILGFAYFTFAANEFSKIYYPYGIILRRSIPISWFTYVRQRAPMTLFFLGAWYYQREYPRTERIDLTCDSEK